ncbi:hypothetical protein [Aliagarivorans taiwanensis]|uniref:hypothetical protein n=1 Tax=Aliagarivorans taiwanensis TaxID=561966 RepID=UPI00047AF1DF|nr:hypothetical protein [Aliagarivorans taiwanensis]
MKLKPQQATHEDPVLMAMMSKLTMYVSEQIPEVTAGKNNRTDYSAMLAALRGQRANLTKLAHWSQQTNLHNTAGKSAKAMRLQWRGKINQIKAASQRKLQASDAELIGQWMMLVESLYAVFMDMQQRASKSLSTGQQERLIYLQMLTIVTIWCKARTLP